jgi:hypothetical protein
MSGADDFVTKGQQLRRAFDDAMERCTQALRAAQPMPFCDARTRLLQQAREDVARAREAMKARLAHSLSIRPISDEERMYEAAMNVRLDALDALLHELSPPANA